jgi:hypothetical protein
MLCCSCVLQCLLRFAVFAALCQVCLVSGLRNVFSALFESEAACFRLSLLCCSDYERADTYVRVIKLLLFSWKLHLVGFRPKTWESLFQDVVWPFAGHVTCILALVNCCSLTLRLHFESQGLPTFASPLKTLASGHGDSCSSYHKCEHLLSQT